MQQFDRIRKRNAFVDNYRKEPMFADNLDEFENSRYVSEPCSPTIQVLLHELQ